MNERKKKKNENKEERVERRGKVVLPYTRGLSEDLARTFKRYDIETIHKPSSTIKNMICNKMKDKVANLDRTGAVYYNDCKKHEKQDYVGETDRVIRERQYEHRIIDHKTAKRSASLEYPPEKDQPSTSSTNNTRKSKRVKERKDYKAIHNNSEQQITEGNTEFSAHVASDTHSKEDLRCTILCTEEDWFKRGVKEAIAIRKIQPTLNQDDGRYHLPAMYNKLIRNSVTLNTPRHGKQDGTEENNF